MPTHAEFLSALAQPTPSKVILLVMDGLGDIHTEAFPQTSLEKARTPNLDTLAKRSALGRIVPADHGVTPGSGPGHLALFGYDPLAGETQIGRGVLEALGINYHLRPGEIAARGNYCTLDAEGLIADRRAGRPANDECRRVADLLDKQIGWIDDVEVRVLPVKEHRFCVMFNGHGLDAALEDTDPQRVGVKPMAAKNRNATPAGDRTRAVVQAFIDRSTELLKNEPKLNGLTLRGFSSYPSIKTFETLYGLNPAAVAAYPLYRGVAKLAGMKILETGPTPADQFGTVAANWASHDYFFIHIKKTDSSGEDGDMNAKVAAIEAVDAALPILLDLKPDTLAITGDHSTPHVMKSHSWHPVPLLINGPFCDIDAGQRFTESECRTGSIGTVPSDRLLGLMLANAGKLGKFGA